MSDLGRVLWVGVLLLGGGCGGGELGGAKGSTMNVAIDDEIGSICATRADGSYRCWNDDGTPASAALPAGDYVRVQLARAGLVGLTRDGELRAAGFEIPNDLPPIADFRATNMGGGQGLCLISAAGAFLYGTYDSDPNADPDGSRWHGEAGPFIDGTCAFEGIYAAVTADGTIWPSDEDRLPGNEWQQVAVGAFIACGLTTAGEVRCASGSGDAIYANPPFSRRPSGPYLQIAVTYQVACALRADGAIVCSRFDGLTVPVLPGRYFFLEAGRDLLCGIRTDGTAACFRQSGRGGPFDFGDSAVTGFAPLSPAIDEGW